VLLIPRAECACVRLLEFGESVDRESAILLFERLVATNPRVERKGDTMPYTSRNGHMFSVLTKENQLALRLPPGDREAFLEKYKTKLSEQYGHVQPEYVVVPDALLAKTRELQRYFDISYTYVGAKKPKATTKSKAKAAKKK